MSGDSSGRSFWFVPVLVAIITAVGAVVVAVISQTPDDPPTPLPPDTELSAPNIEGAYYLDPNNPRIILIESTGGDSFGIQEQLPASWPFYGTVTWNGSTFEGLADFDAGEHMKVVLEKMPDGRLLTEFQYIHDRQGVSIDRVDKHVLVPVS